MEYSVGGLVGSAVALVAGLAGYVALLPPIERWLRVIAPKETAEQREDIEFKLGVMRRLMLSIGFVVFGWSGYWLGKTIAG